MAEIKYYISPAGLQVFKDLIESKISALKEEVIKLIPKRISELENDSNYISSIPVEYVTETELTETINGITPVRGRDYWTQEDINEIETYCQNYISTQLLGGAS